MTDGIPPIGGEQHEASIWRPAWVGIVRRSASNFTSRMRNVQVQHHRRDGVVRVAFSEVFDAAARTTPVVGAYEINLYGEAAASPADLNTSFHNPAAFPTSLPSTEAWLARYVVNPTP